MISVFCRAWNIKRKVSRWKERVLWPADQAGNGSSAHPWRTVGLLFSRWSSAVLLNTSLHCGSVARTVQFKVLTSRSRTIPANAICSVLPSPSLQVPMDICSSQTCCLHLWSSVPARWVLLLAQVICNVPCKSGLLIGSPLPPIIILPYFSISSGVSFFPSHPTPAAPLLATPSSILSFSVLYPFPLPSAFPCIPASWPPTYMCLYPT